MSASNKKKLRKEQESEMLTARQRQEKAEAKKLRNTTIAFVAVMALVIGIAVGYLIYNGVTKSGVLERHTTAAVIGDEEINSVVMSYYYNDAINKMYSEVYDMYSEYLDPAIYFSSMGLDLTQPLNEQTNPDTGATWADYFVDSALESAKSDFVMAKLAKEAGFTLPEEDVATIDNSINNISLTAQLNYGTDAEGYLTLIYGYGADEESYREYLERTALAEAYYAHHYDEISYDDETLKAYDEEHANEFNSYSYSYCYLSYTEFRQGGTEDENGNKTYSEEENNAAREALKEAAEELATAKSLDEMKEMAEKIEVNEDSQVAVNTETKLIHTSINKALADWLADESRKEGDIAAVANVSGEGDDAVTNGYYVAYFDSKTDNKTPISNVRHLLVEFEGGTEDEETGEMIYTDEEKAAAKEKAEELLKQWQDGDATEESFIELVKEHSADSNATEGGLYEDISPETDFVPTFLDWCTDASRKVGDVDIVETEYGYHIMYYVSANEMNYRDQMITNQMKTTDQENWYTAALEAVTATKENTKRLKLDMVISG